MKQSLFMLYLCDATALDECVYSGGCGKHLMLNVGTDITWPVIRQPIQSNPMYWGPAVGLFRNPDSWVKCCGCNVWTVPGVSSYCSVNPQPGGHRLPLILPVLESWSQHRSVGMPTVCVCACVWLHCSIFGSTNIKLRYIQLGILSFPGQGYFEI